MNDLLNLLTQQQQLQSSAQAPGHVPVAPVGGQTQQPPTAPSGGLDQQQQTGPLASFIRRLSPADQAQAFGISNDLSSAAGQRAAAQGQLAQSEAMRKQLASAHPYGWGGGIGNGLASVFEGLNTGRARSSEQEALAKSTGAENSLFKLLLKMNGGGDAPAPSLDDMRSTAAMQGGVPFGF